MGKINSLVAITGARGFVGSHVTELFTRRRIPFASYTGDITNAKELQSFMKRTKPSILLHLAGITDPTAHTVTQVNIAGTCLTLESAWRNGVRKIIFASSCAVYGKPLHSTGSLESDPLLPESMYGKSKAEAEKIIAQFSGVHKLTAIILRFTSMYGPDAAKGVIAKLMRSIHATQSITVYGDGTQSRQFLHVSDASEAIYRSLAYRSSLTVNITTRPVYSVNDLVGILAKKYRFSIRHKPAENDILHTNLDGELAASALGFTPKHTLLEKELFAL